MSTRVNSTPHSRVMLARSLSHIRKPTYTKWVEYACGIQHFYRLDTTTAAAAAAETMTTETTAHTEQTCTQSCLLARSLPRTRTHNRTPLSFNSVKQWHWSHNYITKKLYLFFIRFGTISKSGWISSCWLNTAKRKKAHIYANSIKSILHIHGPYFSGVICRSIASKRRMYWKACGSSFSTRRSAANVWRAKKREENLFEITYTWNGQYGARYFYFFFFFFRILISFPSLIFARVCVELRFFSYFWQKTHQFRCEFNANANSKCKSPIFHL